MRTIGYFLSMATFGLIGSSLGPILPDLAAQVSTPLNVISVIFTARAGGFLVGSFVGGKIIDRFKGHLYLVVCFIAQAMILAFIPFVTDFWLLISLLFISGITLGFVVVSASTYIVWEHAENAAPWVSAQSFFNGVGNFLSPLVISLVISSRGEYARSFWIYALVSIVLSALFLYVPSPKIRESQKSATDMEALGVKNTLVYLVALIFLLYTGSEVTYNSWVFTMSTTAYPLTATAGRLLNSLFWGALAVGRIFVGILSRRLQPARILTISFSGAVVSFLLAIILPGSAAILWVSTISAGLFMAVIFPTLTLYADRQLRLTGSMTGTFFMATSVGGMLMPWIAGQAFTLINPHWVKAITAFGLLCGLLIFLRIERQVKTP
jgi:FHS family Na+ dependent glucose MFS transporter 1